MSTDVDRTTDHDHANAAWSPDADVAIDVWAAFDHHSSTPPTAPRSGDVPASTDETIQIDGVVRCDSQTAVGRSHAPIQPATTDPAPDTVDRRTIAAAVAATIALLIAAVAFFATRGSSDVAADTAPTTPAPEVASSAPDAAPTVTRPSPAVEAIDPPPVVDLAPTPPSAGPSPVPTVDPVGPATPPAVVPPAPSGGNSSPPPTPTPPLPSPELQVQTTYELDPGVHGVTISLHNQGDAVLDYELTNVGDGYQAAEPAGQLDAGASADVWIDLEVSPDGDGPTPFERTVEIASNGGDAMITVTGQVEKPGHLVADHLSLPLIDHRATVSFTNIGGLPVSITEIDAPGFTWALLPDEVAAGETLELDVAICADDADQLPVLENVPVPGPIDGFAVLGYEFGGHFTVGTDHGTSTVELMATSVDFDPPSCEPIVMVPAFELTLGG
ncbi:MAG: hypothetical protein AAGD33_02325 [Actinomycetota bacterium]